MSTKKPAAKAAKPAAKKPAAKKPAAKKPAVKKPAAKKPAAKKPVSKKPAAKKAEPKKAVKPAVAKKPAAAPAPVKKPSAKVPPKIVSRPSVKAMPTISPEQLDKMDAEQAEQRKIAMAIALRMKKRMQAEESKQVAPPEIKLSRRPTTRAAGKNTVKFPDSDLNRFRKNLLELRESLQGKSGALKFAALERDDERTQEDDDGTDAFMRLQALGQVGDQNRTIAQIDEALHKIEDGTYGVCEMCGQLIRKQRLENLPFARTCMECQSEVEKPLGTR